MNDNENPSSMPPSDSTSPVEGILVTGHKGEHDQGDASNDGSSVVMAELVEEAPVEPVQVFPEVNLAARGGAIASVVLGTWSIVGASITGYSFINALLGLVLGFWGMTSGVRWPWLGVALSLVGLLACVIASAAG